MKHRKKQFRRTVSMRPEYYMRLRNLCKSTGVPMAALLEQAMDRLFDEHAEPEVDRAAAEKQIGERLNWHVANSIIEKKGQHIEW